VGPFVHLRLTEEWLIEAGFDEKTAREVALCDVRYDMEHPGSLGLVNSMRHLGPGARLWSRVHLRRAKRTASPCELGRALHCAQDAESHGLFGLSHIRHRIGLLDRDPDDWEAAPEPLRHRIEHATERLARAYLSSVPYGAGGGRDGR
jgi:hypothetical protein